MKTKIAVFGYKDTLVGQILKMANHENIYEIEYFITTDTLPKIDIAVEHSKRPNNKTEFVINSYIYGKKVYSNIDYIEKLKRDRIKKVFLLEDNLLVRKEVFEKLKTENIEIITFIHPSVHLGGHNEIGEGAIVFPQCYIGYKTDIGKSSIIQSGSIIEHHSVVGNYVDINPRLTTASFVNIKDFVTINISVDIINHITVETGARIGAGSLVLQNCKEKALYYGRPAKFIRELDENKYINVK